MKQYLAKFSIFLLLAAPFGLMVGCEDHDDPIEETGDALEDAGNDIQDAAEDAGDNMEDAAEDTGDAVRDATN
ncbi:MAG: hypothetical protein Q7P63_06475 [Verrucomicrobiota bacterium JB022]|nr:hypothetical protein [Verrucomicrobiota bacterium JB022]